MNQFKSTKNMSLILERTILGLPIGKNLDNLKRLGSNSSDYISKALFKLYIQSNSTRRYLVELKLKNDEQVNDRRPDFWFQTRLWDNEH